MNVKELREKAGISQQELANKTGIPKDRIGKWEVGKGQPKAEDFTKLTKFFNEYIPHNGSVASNKPQHGNQSQNGQLDLIKEVTRLIDEQLTVKATLKVLISELAPLIAKASGRSHASVSSQMEKDISAEISHLKTLERKLYGD